MNPEESYPTVAGQKPQSGEERNVPRAVLSMRQQSESRMENGATLPWVPTWRSLTWTVPEGLRNTGSEVVRSGVCVAAETTVAGAVEMDQGGRPVHSESWRRRFYENTVDQRREVHAA